MTFAEGRDAAASARDAAADVRDDETAARADAAREAADRDFAAEDRAAAALDREEAARRSAAALARDLAAQARDALAAGASTARRAREDRHAAADDRAAAALDRDEAAADRKGAAAILQTAYRDGLTGAFLRGAGTELLQKAVDRARRDRNGLIVLFIDVDGLKSINDGLGHAEGDRALSALGAALHQGLRSYDVIVRYGGDEFVCALPSASVAAAERRVDELRAILERSETDVRITVGYAELVEGETLEDVVARADRDLYARRAATRPGGARD